MPRDCVSRRRCLAVRKAESRGISFGFLSAGALLLLGLVVSSWLFPGGVAP